MTLSRHAMLLFAAMLAVVASGGCKPQGDAADADRAPAADVDATADADATGSGPAGNDAEVPHVAPALPEHPALRVATLDHGDYDVAERRGKWVVVNFWATWCAPCREEMPELSALDAMHEHIEVIGLAYEDIEPKALREFLAEHPVVYPIAIVDTYDPPADFETPRGLPMTYLIAPDGTVARQVVGPVSAREIAEAIAATGGPPANASG